MITNRCEKQLCKRGTLYCGPKFTGFLAAQLHKLDVMLRTLFTFSSLFINKYPKHYQRQFVVNMGGHALKNTVVSRVGLKTLNEVKSVVKDKLSSHVEVLDFPYERPGKTDFGDIDVLYKPTGHGMSVVQLVESVFQPAELVVNGIVISFAYPLESSSEYIQVDLIKVSDMEMAKFYYSYGDCGNLLGSVTHHHGIKFGNQGLFLTPTNETIERIDGAKLSSSLTDKIILSTDPEEICRFLGLDYDKWKGFSSTSDIFEWIKSCRLYHNGIFVDNRKHRKKVDIRPMYRDFVATCESEEEEVGGKVSREDHQMEAIVFFKKEQEVRDAIAEVRRAERRRELFNASRFMSRGYTAGPALGEAMAGFKREMREKFGVELNDWLDSLGEGAEAVVEEEVDQYCSNRRRSMSGDETS